jgi:hypothetical protein
MGVSGVLGFLNIARAYKPIIISENTVPDKEKFIVRNINNGKAMIIRCANV